MKEGYEYFQSIGDQIGKRVQGVLMDPFYWVMMFLLLCCMVMAYSGASQGRLAGSIVNTLRQVGSFLIDTFNSIIQACRSLFGFLDVLKLLFFGHLGHSTLYVLTNYAIIFLSMASFFTTLQGLYSLVGLTGFLVSFGVQVMELVTAMGLIICWVPPKGKLKETVTYKYCDSEKLDPCTCSQSSNGSNQLIRKNQESRGVKQLLKQLWQDRFRWGNFKRFMLPILLLLSYIASATFSYCYIFDAVVMPEIAYDDYMESIDLVVRNTESFEQELTTYRSELVRELSLLNDDVSNANEFARKGFSTLQARIQALQESYNNSERVASGLLENMQVVGPNDPNYATLRCVKLISWQSNVGTILPTRSRHLRQRKPVRNMLFLRRSSC